ncbi:hypothetical protein SAMN04487783_1086 [Agrococcus baldri]|uniref:Uncharacterized protein n=1 Tax=Agrococcus baldri TaxID=153730 RepID=A0AA94HLU5_9MICO|nr:hypothetical protein [Agrococcus baldri]SFS08349.1 hypothetical protein SAMN04487783_1086 [Agrococcus baldri]
MRIELQSISKGKGIALPTTSCAFASGEVTRAVCETEQRPTVLGLIAAGRMQADTGRVLLDGDDRARREIRRRTALVDAPGVSDPDPNVSLGGAIAEELLYAGIPGTPLQVRRWAEQLGVAEHLAIPIADVSPTVRVRVLAELATLRDDVEAIVIVSPDRHGGQPGQWWAIAQRLAERGYAVLAIAGSAADAALTNDEESNA